MEDLGFIVEDDDGYNPKRDFIGRDFDNIPSELGNRIYLHIAPNPEMLPEKRERIADETPIVFVPGWSIERNIAYPIAYDFVRKSGRELVCQQYPRWTGGEIAGTEDFSGEVVRRARLLVRNVNEATYENTGKLDVVAHSEGAMIVLAAAVLEPEFAAKLRDLVFVSPVGITGNDSLPYLMRRFAQHLGQDIFASIKSPENRLEIVKLGLESAFYVAKNPLRALREAKGISSADYYNFMKELRAKGARISIIQGSNDKLTPVDTLKNKVLQESEATFSGPPMQRVKIIEGGHDDWVYGNPEEFVAQSLSQLQFLNEMRKSEERVVP